MNKALNKTQKKKYINCLFVALVLISSPGCSGVAVALLGAGAGVGVSYTLDGFVYKTVMKPTQTVEQASVRALKKMGIAVTGQKTRDNGVLLVYGRAEDRNVIVRLEPVSKRSTRIRTRVQMPSVILHDKATAVAIIAQTERVLARG